MTNPLHQFSIEYLLWLSAESSIRTRCPLQRSCLAKNLFVSDMVRPLDVQDGMKMAELNLIKFPDMFWYTVYVSVEQRRDDSTTALYTIHLIEVFIQVNTYKNSLDVNSSFLRYFQHLQSLKFLVYSCIWALPCPVFLGDFLNRVLPIKRFLLETKSSSLFPLSFRSPVPNGPSPFSSKSSVPLLH